MHAHVCEAYESTRMRIARDSKQVWWVSPCQNRFQFYESLQSDAQSYSFVLGNEVPGCECRGWQRKWKAEEFFQDGKNQKWRASKRFSIRQRKKTKQFILQRSWTYVTWKNAKLDKKIQKYKGRVVTRDDVVQNDLDSFAVFTVQESSASHMTAAKVMNVISGLPGCERLASDALSAYTHMKMGDGPRLLGLPESECPAVWTCRPWPRRPNSWDKFQHAVVPRKRNFYGHSLPR